MSNVKIGDVVEICTANGLAYAKYVQKHKQYGALIKVFRGFYEDRPDPIAQVVSGEALFQCFFPLSAAVKRNIVKIVGSSPLSSEEARFPIFRAGVVNPATGKVETWWLWDGDNEWRVDRLTAEQRKLPIRGVWNDALLVERIERGWTPENDPT